MSENLSEQNAIKAFTISPSSTSEDRESHCQKNENEESVEVISEFGDNIDSHPPDGGVMAWLQVLGSWTAIVMTFGLSSGTSVLMQWLLKNYLKHYSASRVGWMFSIQRFIFYFMGVLFGPIVDAYGVRCLIIPGSIGMVVCVFLLSVCKEYYQFVLCFSILGGFASSLIFNPCVSVLTHWFDKRRGLAIGIAASGSGVGGIIFNQINNKMLDHVSFGWSVRTMAFIVLFCGVVSSLTLTSRHTKRTAINWEDMKPDLKALLEPDFFWCTVGLFFVEWGLFIPMQYIVSYAVDRNFSRTFGTNLVSYLDTASIVTRIVIGQFADQLGSFNMMILSSFLSFILCVAVWLPAGPTRAGLTVFCVLFGITSGAVVSLSLITVPRLCHVRLAGRRFGTAYMIASFSVLTGIPLAGALVGDHYLGVILFTAFVYLLGAVAFFISRYYAVRWKLIF